MFTPHAGREKTDVTMMSHRFCVYPTRAGMGSPKKIPLHAPQKAGETRYRKKGILIPDIMLIGIVLLKRHIMNTITPVDQHDLAIVRPLDQNPAAVYLAGLKPSGRYTQRQMLDLVGRMLGAADALSCPWGNLRFQHVAAIRAELEKRYKPATINKALAALRGAMRAAWLLGQMPAEEYHKAREVKGVRNITLPAGRELTAGEIAALIATCENDITPAGARDAAVIAVAYMAGLRREELAGLDLADYDTETGKLIIRGKGSKERTGYLINGASRALADWLALRGSEPGALFQPINKGGRILAHRMVPQTIYNLLSKRGAQAGVEDFSPHDLRRTFVSDLLEAGADISTVAKLAGHASVITTQRYDRRPEAAKQKVAGLLHLPYRGRLVR